MNVQDDQNILSDFIRRFCGEFADSAQQAFIVDSPELINENITLLFNIGNAAVKVYS